jgi:hypothetical protein
MLLDHSLRGLEPITDGGIVGAIDAGWWHYQEPFSVEFDLEVVRWLAGLRDVEGNARGGVRATAIFLADVTVAGWFNDNDGNPVIDEEKFFDATVEASILIRLEGGAVSLATIEDAANARAPALRWWDEQEALGEVLYQLDLVPALKATGVDFSVLGQPGEASELEVPLGKNKLSLSVSKDPGAGWELTANIDGEQLIVRCEHDVTAWVGGEKEGMYMEPPDVLSTEPGDLAYGNPFYAQRPRDTPLVQWGLSRLTRKVSKPVGYPLQRRAQSAIPLDPERLRALRRDESNEALGVH